MFYFWKNSTNYLSLPKFGLKESTTSLKEVLNRHRRCQHKLEGVEFLKVDAPSKRGVRVATGAMMATVLRKVGLASKGGQGCEDRMGSRGEGAHRRPRSHPHDALVPCARVCDLVNVCARTERPQHRPRRRRRNQMSLLQSLQLRLDLWTSTTGNLLDRSFARRFCNRKPDNELYRSNSFRFEKFDREDDGTQQVHRFLFLKSNRGRTNFVMSLLIIARF